MVSFIQWLREHTIICTTAKEKTVLDEIALDKEFPKTVRKYVILDSLNQKNYSKRKIDIVDTYYYEYIKYINSASDPER